MRREPCGSQKSGPQLGTVTSANWGSCAIYSCKNDALSSHGCRAQGADAAALCELGQFAQDDALRTLTSVRQRIHTRSDRRRDPATSSRDAQTHHGRCAKRCMLYLHATRKTWDALARARTKRP